MFGIPSSPELDEAASVLLKKLGKLQYQSAKKKGKKPKTRLIQGSKCVLKQCSKSPLLIILSKRIEGIDTPGSVLDLTRKTIESAKSLGVPVIAVLSRYEIGSCLKPWMSKPDGKGFCATAVAVVSNEDISEELKRVLSLIPPKEKEDDCAV